MTETKRQPAGNTASGKSDVGRLLDIVNGYQQTCVLVTALQVGLVDALAKRPMTEEDLARELGAHELATRRLVRALRAMGIVERSDGAVLLTRTGRLLQSGNFNIRDWGALVGDEYLGAWGNLRHAVMTGESAFERAFGMSAWEHRQGNPELNQAFNRVTASVQLRTINALVASYDFSGKRCIVDVGGGHGNLVAGVLGRYPEAEGIIFDLPHVVSGAQAALKEAGVSDRCRIEGGSFLESVPSGGDAYLLKHVLHNWQDSDCVTILKNCGEAMGPSSVLVVLENVMPEEGPEESLPLVMLDVHMMAMHGGRERTVREFDALFSAAGLRLSRVIPTRPGAPDIVEAVR